MSAHSQAPFRARTQPAAIGLLLAVVILAAVGGFAFLPGSPVVPAEERARGARQTLDDAARLLSTVESAEAAARRFLLTRSDAEIAAFEDARGRYSAEFNRLRRDYMARNDEAVALASLHAALGAYFLHLGEVIERTEAEGSLSGLKRLEAEPVVHGRRRIHGALRSLQHRELAHVGQTSADMAQRADLMRALNAGLIAIVITLAGTGAWLLFRRVRELQSLITVCAWTNRVRWHGRWISFEEYLEERFQLHCTHGICEEAAEKLLAEPASTESTAPFSTSTPPFGQSAAPFADSAPPFGHSASPFAESAAPFAGKTSGVRV